VITASKNPGRNDLIRYPTILSRAQLCQLRLSEFHHHARAHIIINQSKLGGGGFTPAASLGRTFPKGKDAAVKQNSITIVYSFFRPPKGPPKLETNLDDISGRNSRIGHEMSTSRVCGVRACQQRTTAHSQRYIGTFTPVPAGREVVVIIEYFLTRTSKNLSSDSLAL
jgi:hypothetical protein